MNTNLPTECEVVIIGGGVAGCSAAYHLSRAGVKDICLLEAGSPGEGSNQGVKKPAHSFIRAGDSDEHETVFKFAGKSGTAVLPDPVGEVKMIENLYPCSSEEFLKHHGADGARRYLDLAYEGIQIEKAIHEEVTNGDTSTIRFLGTLYVAEATNVSSLKTEFQSLQEFGCRDIEWWDKEKVYKAAGGADAGFEGGIYFPHDGIINSTKYCKSIISALSPSPPSEDTGLRVFFDSPVKSIVQASGEENGATDHVTTLLADGRSLRSRFVVLASGGLFMEPSLTGILTPCWSYLVGIPDPRLHGKGFYSDAPANPLQFPHCPNLVTWGYTHDYCMTNGYLRMSGEDHFSALKPPKMQERCRSLAEWTYQKYPYLRPPKTENETKNEAEEYLVQYGTYSETPDHVPLVGRPTEKSRICYLLGCNAWGQASLSYCASLVPGVLGYVGLSEQQQDKLKLVSITRFSLLPVVREGIS